MPAIWVQMEVVGYRNGNDGGNPPAAAGTIFFFTTQGERVNGPLGLAHGNTNGAKTTSADYLLDCVVGPRERTGAISFALPIPVASAGRSSIRGTSYSPPPSRLRNS